MYNVCMFYYKAKACHYFVITASSLPFTACHCETIHTMSLSHQIYHLRVDIGK